MNEQCPFFNGDGLFMCDPIQSLPVARRAIDYEGVALSTVQKDLCKGPDTSRETNCPAFSSLAKLGSRSQFAKPVINNRPVR